MKLIDEYTTEDTVFRLKVQPDHYYMVEVETEGRGITRVRTDIGALFDARALMLSWVIDLQREDSVPGKRLSFGDFILRIVFHAPYEVMW